MIEKRLNHEPPAVTATLGWRYHHLGIPHTQTHAQEHHVAHLGVYVSGFETSPYGIEWIRFEPHCRVPEIVRTVPHIAFAVDDLDQALKGREILIAPTEPSVGVRVAFILDDGAPVELLQFDTARAVRPKTRLRNNALHPTTARAQKKCALAGERERYAVLNCPSKGIFRRASQEARFASSSIRVSAKESSLRVLHEGN